MRTIAEILQEIRSAPEGATVELPIQDRITLDRLFVSGWPDVGYYAGHKVIFTPDSATNQEETPPERSIRG